MVCNQTCINNAYIYMCVCGIDSRSYKLSLEKKLRIKGFGYLFIYVYYVNY